MPYTIELDSGSSQMDMCAQPNTSIGFNGLRSLLYPLSRVGPLFGSSVSSLVFMALTMDGLLLKIHSWGHARLNTLASALHASSRRT
jgi:hypothetical protein